MTFSDTDIKDSALRTLRLEADAIQQLTAFVDQSFVDVAHVIYKASGRVVVTGIGKSANIANKIVATMNSTGTPAVFMHAADAIHGDLGNVQPDDVVLCISKSGSSPEIKVLVPLVKNLGNTVVGMVGNLSSFLAEQSDFVLNTTVEKEACPNNLAPTTSTAAQLAMGDALAIALMEMKGFTTKDFAKFHPGGALGKKLYIRLDHFLQEDRQPRVGPDTAIRDVIMEISGGRMGAAAVTDGSEVIGIITDGDVRRMIEHNEDFLGLRARDIMSAKPQTLDAMELAVTAFEVMERKSITQVVVLREGAYAGIVHLHDILKEGIY